MPDTMIDIFSGDAFSSVTMTSLVNQNFPLITWFLENVWPIQWVTGEWAPKGAHFAAYPPATPEVR